MAQGNQNPIPTVLNHHYLLLPIARFATPGLKAITSTLKNWGSAGLNLAWSTYEKEKELLASFEFNGLPLLITGHPKELFRILWIFYLAIALMITTIVGSIFYVEETKLRTVIIAISVFAMINAISQIKFQLRKFVLNHLCIGVLNSKFSESNTVYFINFNVGLFLTILSAGLYYPFWAVRQYHRVLERFEIGPYRFSYTGKASDVFWEYYWAVPFCFSTFGFYYPIFRKRIDSYHAVHTWVGGNDFGSTRGHLNLSSSHYVEYYLTSFFSAIATLGLSYRSQSLRFEYLKISRFEFIGSVDLSDFVASQNEHLIEDQSLDQTTMQNEEVQSRSPQAA